MLVVFTGPSLPAAAVAAELPGAEVRAPACRGDVAAAVAEGADTILLIDGGFAHRFAVAPSELVAALRAGVRVIGAASLGAIRAAECHPAGMEGAGAVQRLYRLGVLRDDDEVAVATEPDRGFRATSVALVNVRFAVLAALRAGLVVRAGARAMLAGAARLPFSERLWDPILAGAGASDPGALRRLCHRTDIKRRDAELAVARVAASGPRATAPIARRPPAAPRALVEPHLLGYPPAVARLQLHHWLVSSGRYRRYWDTPPHDAERACSELAQRRELDYELMRWYAAAHTVPYAVAQTDGELL